MKTTDVIILGGGAAGLMCAIAAGARGRTVVVLEGSNKIGKKILMSGGGRCNFTNLYCEPENFLSSNPNFCISALSRYTQWDFIALVEKHDIPYHEKTAGQLFCDGSSKEIVAMLRAECDAAGVRILTQCKDIQVTADHHYTISCSAGCFRSQSLVVATGGLSIPKMGASDFGYRLARQFGLNVTDTRAGLVPFTVTDSLNAMIQRLSGVSVPTTLTCRAQSFSENMLFTHRGLSGPAILQISSYWQPGDTVECDLLPGQDAQSLLLEAKRARPRALMRNVLSQQLPRALVVELQSLWWPDRADLALADFPDKLLRRIGMDLNQWRLKPAGTEGYRTAEVTLGGIDTK